MSTLDKMDIPQEARNFKAPEETLDSNQGSTTNKAPKSGETAKWKAYRKWLREAGAKIDSAQTLADFKNLWRKSVEEPLGSDWRSGVPMDAVRTRILTEWAEKFEEAFDAAGSTAQRLELMDDAPYGHFANDGILYSNHVLEHQSIRRIVTEVENEADLQLVKDYADKKYGRLSQVDRARQDPWAQYIKEKEVELHQQNAA